MKAEQAGLSAWTAWRTPTWAAASAEVDEVPAFLQVQRLQVVFKLAAGEVLWGEKIQLSQASSCRGRSGAGIRPTESTCEVALQIREGTWTEPKALRAAAGAAVL